MRTILLSVLSLLLCLEGIGQGQFPKANQKYVAEAEAALHAFGGNSDTVSDLSFLKPILEGKRIVYLGESNHHSETYNVLKLKLIRFLHLEMGFNVVAFESNVSSCLHANLVKQEIGPFYILTHSILGCWRTETNIELMDFIKQHDINLAGFDPNLNSLILDKEYYRSFFPTERQLSDQLFQLDSLLQDYHHRRYTYLFSESADSSTEEALNRIRDSLRPAYSQFVQKITSSRLSSPDHEPQKVLVLILKNKLELLKTSNRHGLIEEEQFVDNGHRERLMQENLEFLIDSIYPDEKIIVWAHNAHISKGGPSTYVGVRNSSLNNSLGYRLGKKYEKESYTIGLYGYPGIIGTGYPTKTEQLETPGKNSLESILFQTQKDLFFLETDIQAFRKPMYNYSEGNYAVRSVISDCYDAVIFARNLEPAVLIRYEQRGDYE